MPVRDELDLLIVGGGQAGLASAHMANELGLSYVVLNREERTGDTWRTRYDSLRLFTPDRYSNLPGLPLGDSDNRYPTKSEIAEYLAKYADQLDVRHSTEVLSLTKENATFVARSASSEFSARMAVVATGPFQYPRRPGWCSSLSIPSRHSSEYHHPGDIRGRKVLVVGGGNSGAQIAEELALDHEVTISVATPLRFIPSRVLGMSIFRVLDAAGLLSAPTHSRRARLLRRRGDPVFGTGLRDLIKKKLVQVKPAAINGKGNSVAFRDGSEATFDAVIFCTGYESDYSWLQVPGAIIEAGLPAQDQGISTATRGLGFVGLGWMRSRNSGLIGGVGDDARYVVSTLSGRSAANRRDGLP